MSNLNESGGASIEDTPVVMGWVSQKCKIFMRSAEKKNILVQTAKIKTKTTCSDRKIPARFSSVHNPCGPCTMKELDRDRESAHAYHWDCDQSKRVLALTIYKGNFIWFWFYFGYRAPQRTVPQSIPHYIVSQLTRVLITHHASSIMH